VFRIRVSLKSDAAALVALFTAHMRESFDAPWGGTQVSLERDGFGLEFETLVAEDLHHSLMGLASWRPSYDLHHCVSGSELMVLYLRPEHRGFGIAAALIAGVAEATKERGGCYLRGAALPDPTLERFYSRCARSFPGTNFNVAGRAFRELAELSGESPRVIASRLPEVTWNDEP
jgi:GNAT superfamily N-acetyltransferase